jgi:hypothetical protein
MCFVKILFHCCQIAVGIEFMREKNLFLTCFTHRKVVLWISCELDLLLDLLVNRRVEGVLPKGRLTARPSNAGWKSATQTVLKIGCNSTEKRIYVYILSGLYCQSKSIINCDRLGAVC